MNGENSAPLRGLAPDGYFLAASFQTNGTSDPLPANTRATRGFIFTVTRAGVGLYNVTLAPNLNLPSLPYAMAVDVQSATLVTDWFEAILIGEFNLSTRTFQIQLHRNGTAQEVAATAGNRVNFYLHFRNSTSA